MCYAVQCASNADIFDRHILSHFSVSALIARTYFFCQHEPLVCQYHIWFWSESEFEIPEVYSDPYQTSKMEPFSKIVDG